MRRETRGTKRAFTLIELLVVVAIIAVLTSILLPVYSAARAKARQSVCVSNLRQLGSALLLYTQDFDDTCPNAQWIGPAAFPPNWQFGASSRDLLSPYIRNEGIFVCPSDTELAEMLIRSSGKAFGLSYQYHGNPLGHGNNIIKQVYLGDNNGKPMTEREGASPLSWQDDLGKAASPVYGTALADLGRPADTWAFADAWPGVHGGETTSYFAGTRSFLMSDENRPFQRGVNLVYVDGHVHYNHAVAAAWGTEPY